MLICCAFKLQYITGMGEAHIDWSGQYSGVYSRIVNEGGGLGSIKSTDIIHRPGKTKVPSYGVQGHVPSETFGLYVQFPAIWCNLREKYCYCRSAQRHGL